MQLIREDWKLFRNIDTLCQKAGVHREFIPKLVVKELVDNALDATGDCELELVDNHSFRVTDNGSGIDPDWLEDYFSINRPMISSKLLRLPTRGALGNGLRVVTGAVISTNGYLTVTTRGQTFKIIPQDDGTSIKQFLGYNNDYKGTSILVTLGLSITKSTLSWGKMAIQFSKNSEVFEGKSSPYWYTSEAFFELVNAANMPINEFVSLFVAGPIKAKKLITDLTNELEFSMLGTADLSFEESDQLLTFLRSKIRKTLPRNLGAVNKNFVNTMSHKTNGSFNLETVRGEHDAEIPIVIEAWVKYDTDQDDESQKHSSISVLVNKSPVTADMRTSTKQASTTIWGGGLYIDLRSRPTDFYVSIITPYQPIKSDGKEPDFRPMHNEIEYALKKATAKVKKFNQNMSSGGRNEREIIIQNLPKAIDKTSGDGEFIFSQRQLYYAIRPFVMEAFGGKQLNYNYFCQVITDYEAYYGEIEGMYRDPRGTLYHPHTGEEIPLGTIAVQKYNRPTWTFNKIIFIEKEGYFASLRDVGFPEKYDCALLSSKGYASRAVKDLFDLLGETDEEIQFFCVHDADAAGTKIFETLQEATSARPGRRVRVINLGLEPEEALELNLQVETFESKRTRPVADYVPYEWERWLQSHRVELNAMTTPEFIQWLEDKMEDHGVGKVIPGVTILSNEMESNAEDLVREQVAKKILQQNLYEEQVSLELDRIKGDLELAKLHVRDTVKEKLDNNPHSLWSLPVREIVQDIINNQE
ncbi:ATP-binding protein [Paenibacillus amylolyticus]|uniref:ATP-binding protein n=1 Tax=Paenibacillus amylolyticus TaxID=1451 RepID=UPI00339AA721